LVLTGGPRALIVNHMVHYSADALDRTFAALADPTRRAMLVQLSERGIQTAGDLAKPFAVSLPAVLKHIGVLEDAGLIEREKLGRTVHCRLTATPMESAVQWLSRYERFWSQRLDALAAFVEKEEEACSPNRASRSSAASKRPRRGSSRRGPTPKS
jgi:DNA-binding transcriptional ArsR family regulator